MGRMAILKCDVARGTWSMGWEGDPLSFPSTSFDMTAQLFCQANGIVRADLEDRTKWEFRVVAFGGWELREKADTVSPVPPVRLRRQARIERLQPNLCVGWWVDRPEQKVDGATADDVLRELAPLIGEFPEAFQQAISHRRGWDVNFNAERILITEVIPQASGRVLCNECRGSGQYVGLHEIETCSACKGAKYVTA